MANVATNPKEQAHELIEKLSVAQVAAAVGLFKAMLDPYEISKANMPFDEEPLSGEAIKALNSAEEWLKHNEPISHEQVLAELGITQKEIDSYVEPQ